MLVCSARDYYGDSEAVPNSNKTRQMEVEHTTQGQCVHSVPIKYAPALVNNCEFLIYPWEKITAFRFRSCMVLFRKSWGCASEDWVGNGSRHCPMKTNIHKSKKLFRKSSMHDRDRNRRPVLYVHLIMVWDCVGAAL